MMSDVPYEERPDDGRGGKVVPMRLQKFLARAGVASRRSSENLMTAGRVKVNGEVATELGTKVDPLVDIVAVDGKVVTLADGSVTIILKLNGVVNVGLFVLYSLAARLGCIAINFIRII